VGIAVSVIALVGGSKTYTKGLIAINFSNRRASYAGIGRITARRATKSPLLFLAGASEAGPWFEAFTNFLLFGCGTSGSSDSSSSSNYFKTLATRGGVVSGFFFLPSIFKGPVVQSWGATGF
jgi:hypothetical protein